MWGIGQICKYGDRGKRWGRNLEKAFTVRCAGKVNVGYAYGSNRKCGGSTVTGVGRRLDKVFTIREI